MSGHSGAVNPKHEGTKAAAHYSLNIGAGKTATIKLRLTDLDPSKIGDPFKSFDQVMKTRQSEADEFYQGITPARVSKDEALVMRQALAGMLWGKQYFGYDVDKWLKEHGVDPFGSHAGGTRNHEWFHMVNGNIISMPDKWEYPWYAAWDLAFHTIALSGVDVEFAQDQLKLLLQEFFLHPTGQIPAYEWNFSDVNPPCMPGPPSFSIGRSRRLRGEDDLEFLKQMFSKLMLNFSWWVNRKDRYGKNLFEGGFLGLDNIGVFDRSAQLPTGGHLEQADGTAWMAMFCQNMLEIATELAAHDSYFQDMAIKLAEHFLLIAHAMNRVGPNGMWDEEDGFYYDVLRLPDGTSTRLKVRSMVGLLPLAATTVIEPWQRELVPEVARVLKERFERMPELRDSIHPTGPAILDMASEALQHWSTLNDCAGFSHACWTKTNF